ncbi:hypothetical protein GCM10009541_24690 [Micromonospora gifhornensis]|uniref:Uncharacterized protein n=1 Tax=Micromonospora gifhornensis TaxID=84594 RepID=A0ABQ4IJF8_9ACTN|nr:hypothetical protein [Micromonospora gifhornensis]GIJ17853.1 hypothetical protein Vgi01_45370 [Micromonospora gifhornensis]
MYKGHFGDQNCKIAGQGWARQGWAGLDRAGRGGAGSGWAGRGRVGQGGAGPGRAGRAG